MTTQPEFGLTGRAPDSPGDFYIAACKAGATSPTTPMKITLDYFAAQTGFVAALEVEVKKSAGTLTDVLPIGVRILFRELGNSGGYAVPLRIEKYNTTLGSLDCFIQLQNQGSAVTTHAIYLGGTNKPTNLLWFQTDVANGCYTKGEGVTGEKMGALRVKFATVERFIRLYSTAS